MSPTDASRYGYIVASTSTAGRAYVRGEQTPGVVLPIHGVLPVASHSGTRIGFWRATAGSADTTELRMLDVPGAADRLLTTIPAGQSGGTIAWANDDTGLLYETHSTEPATRAAPSGPASSTLFAFDLSVTQAPVSTSELMLKGGVVLVPLAWDKAGKIASALTTGEGGFSLDYYVWDMKAQPAAASAVTKTKFPWVVVFGTVRTSADARRVLAIDFRANEIHVWPVASLTGADTINAAGRVFDAKWRPGGTNAEIAWVVNGSVSLFTYPASTSAVLYRGQSQDISIMSWRADGSAIVVNDQGKSASVIAVAGGPSMPFALTGIGELIAGAVMFR